MTGSGLTEAREQEIRDHVEREILPTADEVKGILRSGWKPSDRLQLQQACRDLLAEIVRLRADQERLVSAVDIAISRLILARMSMRAGIKHHDWEQVEAWLLAEKDNGWIQEVVDTASVVTKPTPALGVNQ